MTQIKRCSNSAVAYTSLYAAYVLLLCHGHNGLVERASDWYLVMPRQKLNPQKKILGYQHKIKLMDVWTMYFASYLGLGMRYGGGTCTKNHGSTFMTLFESTFHADHNGTIPSFISYSHTKIWCVFHLTPEYANIWAMYYARHLGLGMRYGGWDLHYCDQHEWSVQTMSILL